MQASIERASGLISRALILVLVTGLLGGCGIFSPDESTDDIPPTTVEYKDPTTPTNVIANFKQAYERLDIDPYIDLLNVDFVFYFAAEDEFLSPDGLGFWDYAAEESATRGMFGAVPGLRRLYDDVGNLVGTENVPAVQGIIMNLDPREDWQTPAQFAGDGEEFAAADTRRTYDVNMTVTYTGGQSITVRGQQRFYLKLVDGMVDGTPTQIYQVFAWKDLGVN